LSPFGAEAAKRREIILVMRVDGDAEPDTLKALETAARKQTAESVRPSKLLPPPALDFESMRVAAGCSEENAKCLASIGETLGATMVVRIKVVGTKFAINVVRVRDKKGTSSTPESPNLDADELRYHLALALGDRGVKPPKKPEGPGGLVLVAANSETSLDDIEVFLDDKKFPVSALKALPSGQHQLEVHKPGHEPFLWSGAVRPGQQTKVAVELRPIKEETVAAVQPPPEKKDPTPPVELAEKTPPPSEQQQTLANDPITSVEQPIGERKPQLFYTWMLAGGAVATTVLGISMYAYMNSLESRIVDACGGEDRIGMVDGEKKCVNPVGTFEGCPEGSDSPRCVNGRRAAALTWVSFIGTGVLSAAAVGMFFAEDGPAYFDSDPRTTRVDRAWRRAPEVAIVPFEDGVAASITARY
jgi:hypothetical protein